MITEAAVEVFPIPSRVTGVAGTRLSVPTHVTPAGGQATHCSVVYAPDGWNGYAYWMAVTPYPAGNDQAEDPNIVASHDGVTWVVPSGLSNPIDDQPGSPGPFNSDVDLKFGPDNTLYLFWRTFDQTDPGREEQLYYSTSSDGVTWSAKVLYLENDMADRRLLSPTLVFEEDHWVMWAVDAVPSPNQVVRLESADLAPESGWTLPAPVACGPMIAGKEPWHLFVTRHAGRYVGLLADCQSGTNGGSGDLQFISSTDGMSFTTGGHALIPRALAGEHEALYRSTLVPAYECGVLGYRVWYAGWLVGPPAVWNIYRTWIGPSRPLSGTTHPVNTISPGEFQVIPVQFPPGQFTTAPHINVATDSTRLTVGWRNATKDGFELLATNWTSGAVSTAAKLFWGATPK